MRGRSTPPELEIVAVATVREAIELALGADGGDGGEGAGRRRGTPVMADARSPMLG
jgi:hypothetical protein